MPLPEKMKWPRLIGIEKKRGESCYHWTEGKVDPAAYCWCAHVSVRQGDSKVDYFETVEGRRPVHLATPAMTYDFTSYTPGAPDPVHAPRHPICI